MLVSMQAGLQSKKITPQVTYTTWNPSDKSTSVVLSNGNLTASFSETSQRGARGVHGKTSGKYYFEVTVDAAVDDGEIGVSRAGADLENLVASLRYVWRALSPQYWNGTVSESASTTWSGATPVLMVAYDTATGKVWFGKNGAWNSSADPAAGTGAHITFATGNTIFPHIQVSDAAGQITANFGASAFTYTPPSGFSGWTA